VWKFAGRSPISEMTRTSQQSAGFLRRDVASGTRESRISGNPPWPTTAAMACAPDKACDERVDVCHPIANTFVLSRGSLYFKTKGRFTLGWRSAPVGQEFQPKTWLFEARDGMPEKM
jgi:hypothetical protein